MNNKMVSIVTPSLNGDKYIEDCIKSIKSQTYKNIEHIIVDGGSQDNTIEIIKKYEHSYNMKWLSEPDNGMYDAINKGFAIAKGEIYAWLNTDDMYMPWTVSLVVKVINRYNIDWLSGIPGSWNKAGIYCNMGFMAPTYSRYLLQKGFYHGEALGFVQQESTFWTRRLWDLTGGLDSALKYAGDYHLWRSFAIHAELYTVSSVLSGFRVHDDQKTADMTKYYKEIANFDRLLFRFIKKTRNIIKILIAICTYNKYIKTKFLLD